MQLNLLSTMCCRINIIQELKIVRLVTWIVISLAASLLALSVSAETGSYRLQSGDIIEITVLEDPNLNRRVLVRPDGRVSLPLAGTVQAAGRSLEAVQSEVRARLQGTFVNPPTVTASLIALAPPPLPALPEPPEPEAPPVIHSIYVLGEVQRPGKYDYESTRPVTALQALTMAGGPATFAARHRIQIRRMVDGAETLELFDYDALESGEGPSPSALLTDGDVIVVPERGLFD